MGRASKWAGKEGCACSVFFISCNGDFKVCGCLDSPVIFNISNMDIPEILLNIKELEKNCIYEYDLFGQTCYKDLKNITL